MVARTMDEMKAHITDRAVADEGFRARLLDDPRAVISEELGLDIPEAFTINVYEDTATTAHLLLPVSDALSEEELALVAGGGGGWDDDPSH